MSADGLGILCMVCIASVLSGAAFGVWLIYHMPSALCRGVYIYDLDADRAVLTPTLETDDEKECAESGTAIILFDDTGCYRRILGAAANAASKKQAERKARRAIKRYHKLAYGRGETHAE